MLITQRCLFDPKNSYCCHNWEGKVATTTSLMMQITFHGNIDDKEELGRTSSIVKIHIYGLSVSFHKDK